jgi:hypothetical protein
VFEVCVCVCFVGALGVFGALGGLRWSEVV